MDTLADRYQLFCIKYGQELAWTPQECNAYNTWEDLERDLIDQWEEEGWNQADAEADLDNRQWIGDEQ